MLRISREHVNDILDKQVKPAAFCRSGEEVVFETRDCYDDSVTDEKRPGGDSINALGNPATGPLFVEGAEPGDTLKVEIQDIRLRPWGVMRSSRTMGAFAGLYDESQARIFPIEDGKIRFDENLVLEADPMIGVIGTAPAGEGILTSTPDSHGGNMDCKKIGKGSVLYLPVNVDGALLSMGDLHALMGDGEVFICGVETAGEVTVRVTVLKNTCLPLPFLYRDGKVMTIQSAATLDEAGQRGVKMMREFVQNACGIDELKSGMLMSILADMTVCQIVDPQLTMRVEYPLEALEKYGYQLP